MTAAEIVTARPITEVWIGLGGPPPKRGRACAFYRKGDNHQAVSLNDEKGCFFDHRDNVGGGVLDLVQRIRGCNRADALRWLSDFTGMPPENRPFSPAERKHYASAKHEAQELLTWKERLIDALRMQRTRFWRLHHGSRVYILEHGLDSDLGDIMAELYDISEERIEKMNMQMDMLASTSYADILPVFRDQKRSVAA